MPKFVVRLCDRDRSPHASDSPAATRGALRAGVRRLTILAMALLAVVFASAAVAPLGAQDATGSITGRVTGNNDAPVESARVQALAGGRIAGVTLSRADGTFTIAGLPAGSYQVLASRIGYAPSGMDTVRVTSGQATNVTLTLTTSVTALEQVVTTASRSTEKVLDAPASISVVTSQQIEERPALTAVDNLRGVPGIDIAQGGLVQSAVVARGFNNVFSGAMLTLVDNRFASLPSLRVNVASLVPTPTEDVERIEVLLGPAAALYGPNSANGVLHIITKSPFTSQGTTLTVDAGERSVLRGAARHAGVLGQSLGYKVSGEYIRGDDWQFQDPAEPALFPNSPNTPRSRVGQPNDRNFDLEKFGGEARLDWRFADDAEWINSYGFAQISNGLELTGANGAAQIRNWTYQHGQSRLRWGRLFAQVFANLSDAGNSDSLDLTGTYLFRTGQPIVDQSRTVASQLQYSSDIGDRQSFVYGFDYIFTNPRTGGTINGRNEDIDNVNEYGGYVQSTTRLTPQWDLLFAARADQHSLLDGTFFSPRAAVVYKPTETQNVRLTFNRAYSTPANFSFFLDLLQAANVGGLPYNVRAVGNPTNGYQFQRDCTGGVGSLCMKSPFTPAAAGGNTQYVPANAAAYYPAALGVSLQGGLRNGLLAAGLPAAAADAVIARLGTFNAVGANVDTRLAALTAPATTIAPADVRDIEALKASFTNVLELGYKGVFDNNFRLAVDGWYQRRQNFVTPAVNFTPNAFLDPASLQAGLAAHLAPVLGPSAGAVATSVAMAMARVPLGTVVPNGRTTNNSDIAFTYQNIDQDVNLYGTDIAVDYLFTSAFSVAGTYSWVSDVEFPEIMAGGRPLTLNAPDHKGSLTLRYNWEPRDLSFELRGRYQNTYPVNSAVFVTLGDSLPRADGTGNFLYETPPTSTFIDAQLVWRLPFRGTNGLLFSVNGTNLGNRKVPLFAGVPSIGRLIMTRLQYTF